MLSFKFFLVSLILGLALAQETDDFEGTAGGDEVNVDAVEVVDVGGEDTITVIDDGTGEDAAESEEVAETIEPTPAYRRSCHVGFGSNFTDIQSKNKTCNFLENSCQVKVEINSNGMRVYGECKEFRACQNNAKFHDCYSATMTSEEAEKAEHVCHFCCRPSYCNTAKYAERLLRRQQNKLLK
ncbi:uncharacterized protein LOC120342548 [Styela clava]